MKKTLVIYWSGTGNTEAMANAVVDGMKEAGADVTCWTVDDVKADAVAEFDAVAEVVCGLPQFYKHGKDVI